MKHTNARHAQGDERGLARSNPGRAFRVLAYRMLDHFMLMQDTSIRE